MQETGAITGMMAEQHTPEQSHGHNRAPKLEQGPDPPRSCSTCLAATETSPACGIAATCLLTRGTLGKSLPEQVHVWAGLPWLRPAAAWAASCPGCAMKKAPAAAQPHCSCAVARPGCCSSLALCELARLSWSHQLGLLG